MGRGTILGLLAFGLCGCGAGAGDPTRGGDDTQHSPTKIKGGTGGATGGGSGGATFSNSHGGGGTTVMMTPVAPDAGCEKGTRCYNEANPDEEDCGHQDLESDVKTIKMPGNVLLVFDTSQSMGDDWNGKPRWQAVGDAIQSALMPMADLLTVGTVFFPRPDPDAPPRCVDPSGITCMFLPDLVLPDGACGVPDISSTYQIPFAPGPEFLTTFAGPGTMGTVPPYAPVNGGRTPLKEGLLQAQAALASTTLTGTTFVIVITDGDPNCDWDQAVSTQIVTGWNAMGIKTYVLGVPGLTGTGEAVLNELAAAGGTDKYISPDDPAALEAKIGEIVTSTVHTGIDSCIIDLTPPAEAPEKLHLIATEMGVEHDVQRILSKTASWSISSDGSTVTLEGGLCEAAMDGRYESLSFQFGCVDKPPLDPPPDPVPD